MAKAKAQDAFKWVAQAVARDMTSGVLCGVKIETIISATADGSDLRLAIGTDDSQLRVARVATTLSDGIYDPRTLASVDGQYYPNWRRVIPDHGDEALEVELGPKGAPLPPSHKALLTLAEMGVYINPDFLAGMTEGWQLTLAQEEPGEHALLFVGTGVNFGRVAVIMPIRPPDLTFLPAKSIGWEP